MSQHITLNPSQFLLFPSERKATETEKTVFPPNSSETYFERCESSVIFAVPLNVFGLKIDKQELIGEFEAL
jgi:hypothetical protein